MLKNTKNNANCRINDTIRANTLSSNHDWTEMKFYKIFSTVKNAYWTSDQYGYTTDEKDAGIWDTDEIKKVAIDNHAEQLLVPYIPSRLFLRLRELAKK